MIRFVFLFFVSVTLSSPAMADPGDFRPDKIVYCSDGEFDWDSGQSLYDFVILKKDDGRLLISYLSIPHPSYEDRFYNHAWLKMKGEFRAETLSDGKNGYRLLLNVKDQPLRQGDLVIADDGTYTFAISPSWARETTRAGLCWDSLEPDPTDRLIKPRR